MLLSKELPKIGLECQCFDEKEFESLGLAGYNDGKNVCTFLAAAKYAAGLSDGISMILTSQKVYDELMSAGSLSGSYGICIVDNPRLTYFLLHNALCVSEDYARPRFESRIADSAQISPLAYIAPYNVVIGENTVIEEFVSVKENTVIGDDCVIRTGTKIGGPGFEIKNDGTKTITVTHIGGVVIGNNVEIQQNSNTTYRVYDYGRLGKDGKPRELHIEKALDVTNLKPLEMQPLSSPDRINGWRVQHLGDCTYFYVSLWEPEAAAPAVWKFGGDTASFLHLLVLDGSGVLQMADGGSLRLEKGASLFIPAGSQPGEITGHLRFIATDICQSL